MLNKWVALREKGNNDTPAFHRRNKRPHLASECEYLADAERFRNQIVREISRLIEKIQNPALADHEIRETNDDINHKMREKWHWNKRIHELGGLDYNAIERKRQIEEGGQSHRGYQYFGAAKDLPGVRELLAKEENKEQKKKSARELFNRISPDYYGWRDEEDGVLLEVEAAATDRNDQIHKTKRQKMASDDGDAKLPPDYLNVPSQEHISKLLLEHRKKAMLAKYNL
jgi:pre-mRNA-splicing factor ISY1